MITVSAIHPNRESPRINISRERPQVISGVKIRCPKCQKVLLEGSVLSVLIKCKNCKHWIMINS